eukprot:2674884-Ditylum_brightwellii.AAC.1
MSDFQKIHSAHGSNESSNKTTNRNIHNELIVMMQKCQSGIENDFKEMQARWAIRSTGYLSMLSNTDASNKERQQQHQNHDAATKIQSISCGFIHQK